MPSVGYDLIPWTSLLDGFSRILNKADCSVVRNFPGGIRFIDPNGFGATFDAKGLFQYFGRYP